MADPGRATEVRVFERTSGLMTAAGMTAGTSSQALTGNDARCFPAPLFRFLPPPFPSSPGRL
eukprot:295048-Hanusia_phi.AAC.1